MLVDGHLLLDRSSELAMLFDEAVPSSEGVSQLVRQRMDLPSEVLLLHSLVLDSRFTKGVENVVDDSMSRIDNLLRVWRVNGTACAK